MLKTAARSLALIAALFAAPLTAKAQESDGVEWAQLPTSEELAAAYPSEAQQKGVTGRAVMRCEVSRQGGLNDCRILSESPRGMGFGAAAIGLAPKFLFKPAQDGQAQREPVNIPISFKFPEPPEGSTNVDWLRMPNSNDLMMVFPSEAYRRGKSGEALIHCKVSRQGALYECRVVSESPEGMGFGAAAIGLAPQFQMKPATVDGKAVVDTVNIPIRFTAPPPGIGTRVQGAPHYMRTKRFLASPSWAEAPTYDETVSAYPPRAREEGAGGSATVDCEITADLGLHRCNVIAEEPRGKGFGRAAMQLAEHFRVNAPADSSVDLRGVGTQFRVTFAPEMLSEGSRLIGKPQWTALPTGQAMIGAYPAAARAAKAGTARVQMRCVIAEDGAATACALVSETPEGLGFGEAALSLAPHFRLSIWSDEGLPIVGGQVIIPLRYEPPATPN
jgi:TonB family protein